MSRLCVSRLVNTVKCLGSNSEWLFPDHRVLLCRQLLPTTTPCPEAPRVPRPQASPQGSPGGGCLLQHLLNLGLELCDSFLNLLCSPPPGVCSHGIFILCCLRLINKSLESCSSHHTTESSPICHLISAMRFSLTSSYTLPPLNSLHTHFHAATLWPEPIQLVTLGTGSKQDQGGSAKERWTHTLLPPNWLPGRALI